MSGPFTTDPTIFYCWTETLTVMYENYYCARFATIVIPELDRNKRKSSKIT